MQGSPGHGWEEILGLERLIVCDWFFTGFQMFWAIKSNFWKLTERMFESNWLKCIWHPTVLGENSSYCLQYIHYFSENRFKSWLAGTGKDSQLLLWLSKSTAFLHHWLWTLQSLGLALQRLPTPGTVREPFIGKTDFTTLLSPECWGEKIHDLFLSKQQLDPPI